MKRTNYLAKVALTLLAALFSLTGARAQQTLPFDCGFESNENLEGWEIQRATTSVTGVRSNDFFTSNNINNVTSHGGSNLFAFYYAEENGAYLVSPVFTGAENSQVSVSFYYKACSSYYPEQFEVGYTTDESVTDASQFTYDNTITANNTSWEQRTNTFPAGTKRIAIKYIYTDAYFLLLDDFSFTLQGAPAKPTNLAVNYTQGNTTASVTWNRVNGRNITYNVDVNGTITNVSTTSYTITGIELGKTYTVRVQTVNNQGLQSGWASTSFFSGCPNEYTIPYAYGFEDEGSFNCWTTIDCEDDTENGISGVVSYAAYANTGNGFFAFSSYNGTVGPPQYLISPRLGGIVNGLHVEFYYRSISDGYNETFKVGYSTTNNDPSSFIWGDEITSSSAGYQRFSANYPAETRYVAIQYTSDFMYYLMLDDFTFEEAASVLEPSSVHASNETTSSADISWTAGGSETAWDIYVTNDATDVPDDTTTPTITNTSNNPLTLTDLADATMYYVYVRANTGTETSVWSLPCVFNTKAIPMALPYSYGFEDDALPVSWSVINTDASYNMVRIYSSSPNTGSRNLDLRRGSPDGTQIAILPEVDAVYALKDYEVTFYAKVSDDFGGTLTVGIMTDPTDATTFVQIGEAITPTTEYTEYNVNLNSYTGNGHYIAIKHTSTSYGNTYVDDIEVTSTQEPASVTIGAAGYATYVAPSAVSFPSDVTAFIVTATTETSVTMEAVEAIPAGTAVIVKGEAGIHYLDAATSTDDVTSNKLKACTVAFNPAAENTIYCLANKSNGVGFYPVATSVTIPVGKAYLQFESKAKAFYGFEEDDATSIQTIDNGQQTTYGAIYNIAGQRISKMQKGINIVNGRKVLK